MTELPSRPPASSKEAWEWYERGNAKARYRAEADKTTCGKCGAPRLIKTECPCWEHE